MDNQNIIVRGAREHNLQNINLELPRNSLVVFTGVSGSGKSSLAFDTLYAEGQRRYVESLSSYARQFLGQLPKPDVDFVGGLSPAISIQQKSAGRNPRSTVGTITEISDYLRVLYARLGQGYCPTCERPITAQTREQILGRILALPEGTRFLLLAPVVRGQKGEFKDFFADMLKRGYVRARVDGKVVRLTDDLKLDKRIKHNIEVVIDRLKVEPKVRTRLGEAVEQALNLADGSVIVSVESDTRLANKDDAEAEETPNEEILLSAHYACTYCNRSYSPPSPQLFSFNSPMGMCLECDGIGSQYSFDEQLLIPNHKLSVYNGAVMVVGPLKGMGRWRKHIYEGVGKTLGIDLKLPWSDLPPEHRQLLLFGSGDRHIVWEWKQRGGAVWKHGGKWEGIVPQLLSQFKKTSAGPRRMQLEKYMRTGKCTACNGHRLNPQARAVRVGNKTLVELGRMPIGDLVVWFADMEANLPAVQRFIASELLKEIRARISFLLNVGLHYLSLDRSAPTLSGGEAQRIRLAGQIGSGLVGVLYILDEPSIGLHPRDNVRLLRSLENLRDMGNTVIVVEHDEDTMRAADYLVDFGPGPGIRGGQIVAAGTPQEVFDNPNSPTGQYLTGAKEIAIPKERRKAKGGVLRIVGAKHNNLQNVTVEIPLGLFVCVTGVSGSGKSSLVNDILKEALQNVGKSNADAETESEDAATHSIGEHDRIEGIELIDKVIDIDQTPIGRTPRSNPATYIKVFDEIRSLYAKMAEAKVRGYQSGRFSFNRPGGRCESCEGNGSNKLEMDFLADVWVTCPVCGRQRFNHETLQVKYGGQSIHDVLQMEVGQAVAYFEHIAKVHTMLKTLHDVGLDYIKLGQPSPTLSGGEAQRIKLAKELCRRGTGRTLYILDEPTTGLHFEDIRKLLDVLQGFVANGNTVLVIEHNLDVIKTADWLIDMGPDGGAGGGMLVAVGTPEEVAKVPESHTGQALIPILTPRRQSSSKSGKKAKLAKVAKKPRLPEITHIDVRGAMQHNLKNVSARIPRNEMSVFSGPSGSGKSSLAIDTIYAEGQRRYVESLSSYARQFLGQIQKPRVEQITGLSPAVSIEQKTTSKSPRSTVGTITEIYDYLRILYARLGQRYCPKCRVPIGTQTRDEIVERILAMPEGTKIYIMAPIERKGQEKYESLFDEIRRSGFTRMRVDGRSFNLDEPPAIDHKRKHRIEVVVDRNIVRSGTRTRIAEAVEQSLSLGKGVMLIAYVDLEKDETQWTVEKFSQHLACDQCGTSYEPLNPHNYSFNSPLGWCPTCEGLGFQRGANANLLIGDTGLTLRQGAISAWPWLAPGSAWLRVAEGLAKHVGFSLDVPFHSLEPKHQRTITHGTGDDWIALAPLVPATKGKKPRTPEAQTLGTHKFQYKGFFPAIDEASRVSFVYRQKLEHLVDEVPCSACHGSRLRTDAAATRVAGLSLGELCDKPLSDANRVFDEWKPSTEQARVAGEVLREVRNRLTFLIDVGLDYLTLARQGPTLSGGEAQRIRLASQIGSGLTGVLYVLDEPTIGLHPRDNARLLKSLKRLRDLGNTLILVEHDREVIASADQLFDFGPGAGDLGGEITAFGPPKQVLKSKASLTGQYLSGKMSIPVPTNRRISVKTPAKPVPIEANEADLRAAFEFPANEFLTIRGARQNNLKNIDVSLPLRSFIAVTGVSGSGKSSLINEVLFNTLARRLNRARTVGAAHDEITGLDFIDKVINVDQDPIGNSPSSNPATYTGVFDLIREVYSRLSEAKVRGYHPRRFSFNQKGGRCDACEGMGQKKIEMHFLPDVWVECDTCHGSRYNPETLAVKFHDKSIADVLAMRVVQALELFKNIPKIRVILQTLADVGLGYMALGQSAPTMSGGEAQRVKLAAELARPSTGRTIYLLDEPTTGLHFDDVRKLLDVLHRLADLGNTVIVIEHNLEVIKTADWVIDIGPEAGIRGGQIVAQGTPEVVAKQAADKSRPVSHTGIILKEILAAGPHVERERYDPKAAKLALVGDMDISEVGKDSQLPWEENGERWHTKDRVTTTGKPCKWEGAVLAWVNERIHESGTFSDTNWNHRSIVEISAAKKSNGWFLHAMTGHEAYLKLVFRVGRGTFKEEVLGAELNLKPLSDTPGLEGFSRDSNRVEVTASPGMQQVVIVVHKMAEVETAAFLKFLQTAVASFASLQEKSQGSVEDHMPWKKDGEAWHLGEKGFPPGKGAKWDRPALPLLLKLIGEMVPDVEVKWDSREHILFKTANDAKSWGWWRTKESKTLVCNFVIKQGQYNLSHVEGAAHAASIANERSDGTEVLRLEFTTADQVRSKPLRAFLKEYFHAKSK